MRALILLLIVVIASVSALYGPKSEVIQATDKDFKDVVLKDKGIVIVEFYAPWCGHCKTLAPEYEKAAKALNGVVKIVAVDATQSESLAQKYQVQGFPTLKVFGADKKSPTDYQGQRTSDGIISEAMKQANALVNQRKGGKAKDSGASGKAKEGKKKGSKSSGGSTSDVVELTDTNFNALVMESNEPWIVEFFAPWCGHCKALAPEYEKAARELKADGIKLGAVDATVHAELAQKYGVKGYPTLKMFSKGKAKEYKGPREADGIVAYAREKLGGLATAAPVEVQELTSSEVFQSTCGSKKLCAVLFLPHILDSGAKGRNTYLDTFKEIAAEFTKMPISFVWTEAGAQSGLENALSINGNFPTLAMVSVDKKAYAVPKVSWSKKNLQAFMQGVLSGVEKTTSLSGAVPAIATATAWDGKDGKLQVDEPPLDQFEL